MNKFEKMTRRLDFDIPCHDELVGRGFKMDSWHGERGLNRNFPSKDGLYYTRVYVFEDRIYFYKEYECGGMVYEIDYKFNDYETSMETIVDAFEMFNFN